VSATGIGFAEVMARMGLYKLAPKPPCVVGYDVSGIVEAHGPGVMDGPPIGARVMAICHFGAHAEFVTTPAEYVLPIPDGMNFEEAAAIPWNYLVAHHLIFRVACVRPNDRVLVHMAAGGVGLANLQLLRTIPGVTLFGTASRSKHDELRTQGCEHAIDYRSLDYAEEVRRLTGGEGVDVVFDTLGGRDTRKGFELLRQGGRLVMCGLANAMTGERRNLPAVLRILVGMPRFSPMALAKNRSVAGVSTGCFWDEPRLLRENLQGVLDYCHLGKIHPRIDSVHKFDQAAEAHRRIESRSNVGRVLLVP
jgi:NADPH:quinone reductase-like Zn-dependent oxidoreductase